MVSIIYTIPEQAYTSRFEYLKDWIRLTNFQMILIENLHQTITKKHIDKVEDAHQDKEESFGTLPLQISRILYRCFFFKKTEHFPIK